MSELRRRRGTEQQRQQQQQRQQPPKPKFIDVNFRFGIDDHVCRLPLADFRKLISCWIMAGEDVVLRSASETKEVNIVLRGSQSLYMSMLPPGDRKAAVYNLIRVEDMRRQWLEESGHPGPREEG